MSELGRQDVRYRGACCGHYWCITVQGLPLTEDPEGAPRHVKCFACRRQVRLERTTPYGWRAPDEDADEDGDEGIEDGPAPGELPFPGHWASPPEPAEPGPDPGPDHLPPWQDPARIPALQAARLARRLGRPQEGPTP